MFEQMPLDFEKGLESRIEPNFKPLAKIPMKQKYLEDLAYQNIVLKDTKCVYVNLPINRSGNTMSPGKDEENILLRLMNYGIENLPGMPKEIYNYLNGIETAVILSGTFIRKYEATDILIGNDQDKKHIKIDPDSHNESKISRQGHLNQDFQKVISYLMNASNVKKITQKIKKNWDYVHELKEKKPKDNRIKRYIRANPFDPDTINERLEAFENDYPELVKKIYKALKTPFKPMATLKKRDDGTWREITPGFRPPEPYYQRKKGKGYSFRIKGTSSSYKYHVAKHLGIN